MSTRTQRSVAPLAALESQVSLIRALRNPSIGPEIMGAAQGLRGSTMQIESEGKKLAEVLSAGLDSAPTIVVTDRMLDVILRRLDSIEFGEPLRPEDVNLFPAGYIVFPRPVEVPFSEDDYRDVFPPRVGAKFDAGFWLASSVTTREQTSKLAITEDDVLDVFDTSVQGITYSQSVSLALAEELLLADRARGHINDPDWGEIRSGLRRLYDWGVQHAPVYTSGWGFGLSWDPALREESYVLTPAGEFERRFWLTTFRTLAEEVMAPVLVPRAARRRAGRLLSKVPDVVVADLRRVKYPVKEQRLTDGSTVMWSHRWKVRGHQRTLHRGTPQERTIWVREYEKGPEGAPLIEKDRVYRLAR